MHTRYIYMLHVMICPTFAMFQYNQSSKHGQYETYLLKQPRSFTNVRAFFVFLL